jgi:hypothetical protein
MVGTSNATPYVVAYGKLDLAWGFGWAATGRAVGAVRRSFSGVPSDRGDVLFPSLLQAPPLRHYPCIALFGGLWLARRSVGRGYLCCAAPWREAGLRGGGGGAGATPTS